MTGIILFIILAFIAFCNGDSSGFEAIGKIILYIGLFIVVGAIIAYAPWLILIGIIAFFIFGLILSQKNNQNNYNNNVSNKNNISYKPQENDEVSPINNLNLSDFQRQLQENTKTSQQVEDEKWLKEKEQISIIAKNDFNDIKRKLLDKAKNGQYSMSSGKRHIVLKYYCPYLLSYVDKRCSRNPTGRMGTSSYRANEKIYYHINKMKQYNLYLSVIKELAAKDNISINPFFTERDIPNNRENRITMPYTFTPKYGMGIISHEINAYLECSIEY